MRLGVAYYPEHTEPEQWRQDLRLIKDAGIERIRIVELAGEYDIEVVLCTSTAAPPVWLAERHPEIMPGNRSTAIAVIVSMSFRSF